MKKIKKAGLVLASCVLAFVTACSAPLGEEESVTSSEALLEGPGVWQLRRECGTKETGACAKSLVACDGAIGSECPNAGDVCLGAASASGLRQVLFCNPTSSSTWTYNGDCADQRCSNRPACDADEKEGERCRHPLSRCARNGRVLVCLTNGKTQYAFRGTCGENGGAACASFSACPRDEDGMAGLACTDVGASCQRKTGSLTGKVFTCITR